MNTIQRVRAALFVDFDNVLSGLLQIDRRAAFDFAERPDEWLDGLRKLPGPSGARREILVCRAYLNPAGWFNDAERGNDANRVYLRRFRGPLTDAGFEVVDCPPLTSGQKNAADIRMVIDVLDALGASFEYDEFIIASSDADFTPLLQRLRSRDRRTTIMASGPSSNAYRNIADTVLDAEAIVSLLGSGDDVADAPAFEPVVALETTERDMKASPNGSGPSETGSTMTVTPPADPLAEKRARAVISIRQQLLASDGPLQLSRVGNTIREQIGTDVVESSRWFGRTTLSKFITTNLPDIAVGRNWAWDPAQHAVPKELADVINVTAMPEVVGHLHRATGLPRLPTGHWPVLFDSIAEYTEAETFQLSECSKRVRDLMQEKKFPVSRASVTFVITALAAGGVRLDGDVSPSRADCREGLMRALVDRAAATSWELDATERAIVIAWLNAERRALPAATAAP